MKKAETKNKIIKLTIAIPRTLDSIKDAIVEPFNISKLFFA